MTDTGAANRRYVAAPFAPTPDMSATNRDDAHCRVTLSRDSGECWVRNRWEFRRCAQSLDNAGFNVPGR